MTSTNFAPVFSTAVAWDSRGTGSSPDLGVQAWGDVSHRAYEEGPTTFADGYRPADAAVEQIAEQSHQLKSFPVKNGNFARGGGGILRAETGNFHAIRQVGEIALGGADARITRGPVSPLTLYDRLLLSLFGRASMLS